MRLSHKIRLNQTREQEEYFCRAAGTARFVWNWALAEWNRQYQAGLRPSYQELRRQFNAIKYQQFPWLNEINRDAHSQPFAFIGRAWSRFFADIKNGKKAHTPRFKKKGRTRDSFYLANDQFIVSDKKVRVPIIGWIEMNEVLRFNGKIMSGTISRTAGKWYISIQVDIPNECVSLPRIGNEIVGIDLGIKTAATLSTGESIQSPKPLKKAMRRLRMRHRKISRQLEAAKIKIGIEQGQSILKGTKLPISNNRKKASTSISKLYARTARIRNDFLHKLTTRLCRENQTIVIEGLNIQGMIANDKLAKGVTDVGFGEFRRQLEYKSARYGNNLIIADRWFPSSRLCSVCGWKNKALTLEDREWICQECGTAHDRDVNAAINLSKLPVASGFNRVGKVTPVRYENGLQDGSGQELKESNYAE